MRLHCAREHPLARGARLGASRLREVIEMSRIFLVVTLAATSIAFPSIAFADGLEAHHFYTTDETEFGTVQAQHGMTDEGVIGFAWTYHAAGTVPLHRLYNV